MIRSIIRLFKAIVLFSLPLGCGIGIILAEVWICRHLQVFLGSGDGADMLTIFIGLGMLGTTVTAFCLLIGEKGCDAYSVLIQDALAGTQRPKKEWWKV